MVIDSWQNIQAVEFSRFFLDQVLKPGDWVIDATCGNGHDTAYLAQKVGQAGKVLAFDIQDEAILKTYSFLKKSFHLAPQVVLYRRSHAEISAVCQKKIKGAVFNLGYLPGGDKSRITVVESTVKALRQAVSLLLPGGLVSLVVYAGHPGGKEEKLAVEELVRSLDPASFQTMKIDRLNKKEAPYNLLIWRNYR